MRSKLRNRKRKYVTYVQIAMTLMIVSAVLFLFCVIEAVLTAGDVPRWVGLLGILSFLSALAGVIVTLYGHFIVRVEGKVPWLAAFLPNLFLVLLTLIFYIGGMV